jgi:hypothetical protein
VETLLARIAEIWVRSLIRDIGALIAVLIIPTTPMVPLLGVEEWIAGYCCKAVGGRVYIE